MTLWMFLVYLVPMLLLVLFGGLGMLLLARGIRGDAVLSFPTCASCGYDLRRLNLDETRACPECGRSLSDRRAVRFGRYRRRPGIALLGVAIMLAPILLLGGWSYFSSQRAMRAMQAQVAGFRGNVGMTLGTKTTAELLQMLPATIDQPPTWKELASRFPTLTDDEVAAVIEHLLAHAGKNTAGLSDPMWSRDFLIAAITADRLSNEQLQRLLELQYDRGYEVRMRQRVRSGGDATFHIAVGRTINVPLFTTITWVSNVTLNETTPVEVHDALGSGPAGSVIGSGTLSGRISIEAEPGRHQLKFDISVWVVRAPFRRASIADGSLPPPVHQLAKTVTVDIDVVPASEQVVTLRGNDPAMAEAIRRSIRIREFRVSRENAGRLVMSIANPPPIAVSVLAYVRLEGEEVCLGSFTAGAEGGIAPRLVASVPEIPRSTKYVDLILRPHADAVEREFAPDEIWGEELVFAYVPVVFD